MAVLDGKPAALAESFDDLGDRVVGERAPERWAGAVAEAHPDRHEQWIGRCSLAPTSADAPASELIPAYERASADGIHEALPWRLRAPCGSGCGPRQPRSRSGGRRRGNARDLGPVSHDDSPRMLEYHQSTVSKGSARHPMHRDFPRHRPKPTPVNISTS
jgi:hypothetical protein